MNKYTAAFFFNDEWVIINFNSNQLANAALIMSDAVADFRFQCEGQDFDAIMRINGKKYNIVFTPENPKYVSVYNTEEDDGHLVQANIPWLLLKVVDGQGNTIYDINRI